MKFSFLGFNQQSRPLAEAILSDPQHQLMTVYEPGDNFPADKFPGVRQEPHWESVLHNSEFDVVVISPVDNLDNQEDRLRRVVQCELPAIAIQPFCSVLAAFEMEMIQAQTTAPLICYLPADSQPLALEIGRWLDDPTDCPVGRIWKLSLHSHPLTNERNEVLKKIAYDATIVRTIAGPVRQVCAVTNSTQDDSFDNLNVIFTTDSPTPISWYFDQSLPSSACELRIAGAAGEFVIDLSDHHTTWKPNADLQSEPFAPAAAFLDKLPDRLAESSTDRSWVNWCTDLDVAETVPTSLRRRRSIDILEEVRTEEGSFKGLMSMGGCALLLATLFVLLAGTIIEGFRFPAKQNNYRLLQAEAGSGVEFERPKRSLLIRLWPVYPFAIFLLLQFLRFVIQSPGNRHSQVATTTQRDRASPS